MVQAPTVAACQHAATLGRAPVRRRGRKNKERITFCVGPVGVEIGQGRLITDLLERLGGLVIHLEDAARSPPAGTIVAVGHVEVDASSARRAGSRVVGDGSLEENWGRQLGGIGGVVGGRWRVWGRGERRAVTGSPSS